MQLNRRKVLGATAAGLALPPGVASASRKPRRTATFVFVSGANGAAFAPPELTLLGHRAVGVELPGHGVSDAQFRRSYQAPQDLAAFADEPSPMAGIGLSDYVAATVAVVRRVARFGPVVLVGASMGGATITRVGNAVPELLDRIVYLSAFCCSRPELPSAESYLGTPEAEDSLLLRIPPPVADPGKIGALRINWRAADPEFLALWQEALMADASEAEFLGSLASFQPDESVEVGSADSRLDPATWGRVPHTYIRCSADRCLPPALQQRMIADADGMTPRNRFDVRTVDATHSPSAAGWRRVVRVLDELAPR